MKNLLNTREKAWLLLDLVPGMPKKEESRAKVENVVQGARGALRSQWLRRCPLVLMLAAGISAGSLGQASDVPAFGERTVLEGLSEFFHTYNRELNTIWKLAQNAGAAYKTYKVAQSLYQRIHSGNIGLTVSLTLPSVIEIPVGGLGNGTVETLMIRPNSPWNNPGSADLGAFQGMLGQHGVTFDANGLLNQLAGLALADWDFDNYRVSIDPKTGQVKRELDLNSEVEKARKNAVGSFLLAGRVFSDAKFANKYFSASGATGNSGNLVLDYGQLANVYKKSEYDKADAIDGQADATEAAASAAGLPMSAFAFFQRAQAKGIRDMADKYPAGSPGGDFQVARAKQITANGAQAAENIGNAGVKNVLSADAAAKATKRAKDMKTWYDITQSGTLNLSEFFIKSLYPNGSVDTSQHGAKGEGYKAANAAQAVQDQSVLHVQSINEAEVNRNAQLLSGLGTEQEIGKMEAAAKARSAEQALLLASTMKILAGATLSTPYPVTINAGDFSWSFTIDASNPDGSQGMDQGEAAAQAALGQSFGKVQSQFADGIVDFRGVGEVIQKILDSFSNSGMVLFGFVFNDPEPDERADQA